MPNGYPINWALPAGSNLSKHPLYIKYSGLIFQNIDPNEVRQDLNNVMAIAESAEIVAYLAWLMRTVGL